MLSRVSRVPWVPGSAGPGLLEPRPLLRRQVPTRLELLLLEATPGVLAGGSVLAGDHGGGGWTKANQLRVRQGVDSCSTIQGQSWWEEA